MTGPLESVEVVVTAENADWLADFTRSLVEDGLVACGHSVESIRAIYRWEGQVHDEPQARVGLHTRALERPASEESESRGPGGASWGDGSRRSRRGG